MRTTTLVSEQEDRSRTRWSARSRARRRASGPGTFGPFGPTGRGWFLGSGCANRSRFCNRSAEPVEQGVHSSTLPTSTRAWVDRSEVKLVQLRPTSRTFVMVTLALLADAVMLATGLREQSWRLGLGPVACVAAAAGRVGAPRDAHCLHRRASIVHRRARGSRCRRQRDRDQRGPSDRS